MDSVSQAIHRRKIRLMKKIVVDARTIKQNPDGIGYYSIYFVKRLVHRFGGTCAVEVILPSERHDLSLFTAEEREQMCLLFSPQEPFGGKTHDFDFDAWDAFIASRKPDLYISTSFVSTRHECVKAVVIHDIIPLRFPDEFAGKEKNRVQLFERLLADATLDTDLLIAVSTYTLQDALRFYPYTKAAVKILHPDVEQLIAWTRERLPQDVEQHGRFLMIGVSRPRKNVELVVEALKVLKERGARECKVCFLGLVDEDLVPLPQYVSDNGLEDLVEIKGYVSDEELYTLTAGSKGLLYVSHYEGFGMPLIEFFAAGKPVICQRTSSIPEVGGDLALYCDNDPERLADLMLDVYHERRALPTADAIEAHLRTLVKRNLRQYDDVFAWIAEQLEGTTPVALPVEPSTAVARVDVEA